MDPVTALGIAGNAIQFVDFARKLISTGIQYYESSDGTLLEHTELSAAAENLARLTAKIQQSEKLQQSLLAPKRGRDNSDDLIGQGLLDAINQCHQLALEMSEVMNKLK